MISLIVCSRNQDIPQRLRENIAETIGVEYELLVIDNSKNQYSIFTAYNEGVQKAKGDILCFMHEDILYHTYGWGDTVLCHFAKDREMGMIGVVGGHYLQDAPLTWFDIYMEPEGQVIQHFQDKKTEKVVFTRMSNDSKVEVATVDGLWFCVRKDLFEKIRFDETIGLWHGYDIDIAMQVWACGRSVCVCYDILIEHFSHGDDKMGFKEALDRWHEKWRGSLPMLRGMSIHDPKHIYYQQCMLKKASDDLDYRLYKEAYYALKSAHPEDITNSRKIKLILYRIKPIAYLLKKIKKSGRFDGLRKFFVRMVNLLVF